MCVTSSVPEASQAVLEKIDAALEYLEINCMGHFLDADQKYKTYRKTKNLGFERLVTCELYCKLKQSFGDIVFAEFPGIDKERIDLWLDLEDFSTYFELKMYYSDNQGPYIKDFNKLREMVDAEQEAMAVQIHFHFYMNQNHPAEQTLRSSAQNLPIDYWSDVKIIRDRNRRHFVRLAFGKNN